MTKPKALWLLDAQALTLVYGPTERDALLSLVEFAAPPQTAESWPSVGETLSEVELIFTGWGTPVMDAAFLAHLPALKAVFHAAGTVKFFVTDAVWERGVRVTTAAAANAVPVAEFAFAQIILALKHAWQGHRRMTRERGFQRDDRMVPSTVGSTVGLVSLSRTGRLVAEQLRRLELQILAYDPTWSPAQARDLGVELCSLEALFERSHVVSCHAPLLPSTRGLLRGAHFNAMKPGATFINTARGAIVNEAELIAALHQRPDVVALLDVTDPEPPISDSPLYDLPNVVLTPHLAGSMGRECASLGRQMVAEVRRWIAGENLQHEIHAKDLPLLA
jgi:phosphoglycerate dehydrogenase-like enzyme